MTGTSLDQRRAAHALDRIRKQQQNRNQSDYLSYVKALPASILQNGLGQAMATVLAAASQDQNDPHRLLYQDVQDWLCREDEDAAYRGKPDLIEAIVGNDQQHYLRAQAEAQNYLGWLKKFAAAYLRADPRRTGDG